MSCCITAHNNPLALPVFLDLSENSQIFNFSFFFTTIVLRILSFLHAHHDTATSQCNPLHPARTALLCSPHLSTKTDLSYPPCQHSAGTDLSYPWWTANTLKQFPQNSYTELTVR